MKQFAAGFFVASIVWVSALFAQSSGMFDLFGFLKAAPADEQVAALETKNESKEDASRKRQGRKVRRKAGKRQLNQREGLSYEAGDGISGDDIGAPGSRELAMGAAGGEQQLSEAEIDRGIDRVFGGIERCLVLVPAEAPAKGKVVVGMRIAPNGQVTEVNLQGPKTLVDGETGSCIRRIVKSIRYSSFDGPDMLAYYPITFE